MTQAPAPRREVIVRAHGHVRGTQSFVQVMGSVWRRPSLTALEVLWRWAFGCLALWLLATIAWRVWIVATNGAASLASVGLDRITVTDPMAAALHLATAFAHVLPPACAAAGWLAPLLLIGWCAASALGRTLVFRRLNPAAKPRPFTLFLLNLLRVAALAGVVLLWIATLTWAGRMAIVRPAAAGLEPNLVLYFTLIISSTLAIFIAWSAVSWVLSIAPVLSVHRALGPAASLRAAFRLGPLRSKLVEMNLVMGIVKVALIVLVLVFSSTPLPFESYTTPGFLRGWWAGVLLLYLLVSDFFHVVRAASALALLDVLPGIGS